MRPRHRRPEPTLEHVPALDGIRGAAVVGILLFHAGHLAGGWLGVDLFFVLSGYLITSLLLVEYASTGSISLGGFWARRARRLLPALFAALGFVAVYAAAFAAPGDLGRIRADGLATLLYAANWHAIYAEYDYWALFGAGSPLDHAWSLAIEEQFYLFWPPFCLVLLRAARGSPRVLGLAALALAVSSATWMAVRYDEMEGTARVYYGTDTRAAAVLLGAVVAAALRAWPGAVARRAFAVDLAGVVALALLALGWTTVAGEAPWLYAAAGLPLFSALGAVLVAAAVVRRDGFVSRAFSFRPLRGLGLVSYGLYLWHWPLYLVLSPDRTGLSGLALTGVRVAASLAAAIASYYAIELPVRRGRLRAGPALGAGVAAFAAVAVALVASTARDEDAGPASPPGAAAGGGGVLVVGDSAAERLAPMFDALSRSGPLRVTTRAFPGCSPFVTPRARLRNGLTIDGTLCEEARALWLRSRAELRPDLVVLVEGAHGMWERDVDGRWLDACSPRYRERMTEALVGFIETLREAGSGTAIVLMPPVDVRDARSVQGSPREDLGALQAIAVERMQCQNDARRAAVARTGAVAIDLESHLCPRGPCDRDALAALREDGIHFSEPGGRPVARWLYDRFAGAVRAGARDEAAPNGA